MFKRIFGLIAFIMGVALGGFMLFTMFAGRTHDVEVTTRIKMLILPCVLVAFGITWMRGQTFGRR